jgi:hypothetical protein
MFFGAISRYLPAGRLDRFKLFCLAAFFLAKK